MIYFFLIFITSLADAKTLKLFNFHTGRSLNICYFCNHTQQYKNLDKINYFFQDRRSKEIEKIDPNLLDLLYNIQQNYKKPITLISGYRSPKTNAMLRKCNKGVAKRSYHTLGRAADIAVNGVPMQKLARFAKSLNIGGVGAYSHFVHVDTGPVRHWGK